MNSLVLLFALSLTLVVLPFGVLHSVLWLAGRNDKRLAKLIEWIDTRSFWLTVLGTLWTFVLGLTLLLTTFALMITRVL